MLFYTPIPGCLTLIWPNPGLAEFLCYYDLFGECKTYLIFRVNFSEISKPRLRFSERFLSEKFIHYLKQLVLSNIKLFDKIKVIVFEPNTLL